MEPGLNGLCTYQVVTDRERAGQICTDGRTDGSNNELKKMEQVIRVASEQASYGGVV